MSIPLQIVLFLVVSAGIVWLSRPSLRDPGSHGFFRFFAWEVIVALVLMNLDHWLVAPFSFHQMLSWPLLIISLFLIIGGVQTFRKVGKPGEGRDSPSLIGIEKTTRLVTVGLYRHVRHPFYSSLLFLAWGVFFKRPSWGGVLLAGAATILLVVTARVEEAENILFFGEEYRGYMQRTKMFIPFVF